MRNHRHTTTVRPADTIYVTLDSMNEFSFLITNRNIKEGTAYDISNRVMHAVIIALKAVLDPINIQPIIVTHICDKKWAYNGDLNPGVNTASFFKDLFPKEPSL